MGSGGTTLLYPPGKRRSRAGCADSHRVGRNKVCSLIEAMCLEELAVLALLFLNVPAWMDGACAGMHIVESQCASRIPALSKVPTWMVGACTGRYNLRLYDQAARIISIG